MAVYLDQRIKAFTQLGKVMDALAQYEAWPGFSSGLAEEEFTSFKQLIDTSYQSNGWFTRENINKALSAWGAAMTEYNLHRWLDPYKLPQENEVKRKVAVICAGNIPMVGLHDVISVLITGNHCMIKLSSSDDKLIPALLNFLVKIEPGFENEFSYVTAKMQGQEAVIATGSNNSSRYFRYYFKDIPHIIRKSRTSVAILDGKESAEEMQALGTDIFDYFGLGCRNVSKIYLPEGFEINRFFEAVFNHNQIIHHHKYANNYDYNKAVWLLNQENLLDNGFILLKEEKAIASPTASLYYEYYKDRKELDAQLRAASEQLQCVVSREEVPFGASQHPMLWDYADGIDTIEFLTKPR